MLRLLGRRFAAMVVMMAAVSFILFAIFEADKLAVATKVLGPYSTLEQRELWLEENGYNRPFLLRYGEWLWRALQGDFGESLRFKVPVGEILWDRLKNTALLAALVFALMIPIALALGILAGMREGSPLDRLISFVAVATTSVPEFASAAFLTLLFVFKLGWLPGTSSMTAGFDPKELVLPVLVLVLYDFGYVARMTRASMVEVMASPYVRTAILKGLPRARVVLVHALRNALIAPFTVIVLQLNWLLSGVIVVEVFFAYKGFGALLYEAAVFGDIFLIEACALVAVFVAVASQFISDVGYMVLNPKIRFGREG